MQNNITNSEIKQAIVQAVNTVFRNEGRFASSEQEIAKVADCSIETVRECFPDLTELYSAAMTENIRYFTQNVKDIVNEGNTLIEKIVHLTEYYIDMMLKYPKCLEFMFRDVKEKPGRLMNSLSLTGFVAESVMAKQIEAAVKHQSNRIKPLHYIMNIISMCVFPFLGSQMIRSYGGLTDEEYFTMMEERKRLIPIWAEAMMKEG
ncbi:MAG: hypothetical protein QG635_2324 [Bacteroidota bacterium]|nr:hypothetical protein [Bacteroidota bacterium]